MKTRIVVVIAVLLLAVVVVGGISLIRGHGPEPVSEPEVVLQPTVAPVPVESEPSPYAVARAAVSLGKTLYGSGWYAEARSLFVRAREMAPELNDPRIWIAGCDRRVEEIRIAQQFVVTPSSSARARYLGGQAAEAAPSRMSWTREEARELRILMRTAQMMERDRIRKWRYQHGLPTQNPTFWERLIGYADGDPW